MSEAMSAELVDSPSTETRFQYVVELLRDDGLVTALALDRDANVLDDRAVGPVWAAATATLTAASEP